MSRRNQIAGDDEDQQEDNRKVVLGFPVDRVGRRQADDDSLDGQQTARLQRIALERHGQREDELGHQQPAGRERAGRERHDAG